MANISRIFWKSVIIRSLTPKLVGSLFYVTATQVGVLIVKAPNMLAWLELRYDMIRY